MRAPAPLDPAIGETVDACRNCGHQPFVEILSLGETPIADRLLKREDLAASEATLPLDLVLCSGCGLLQIAQTVESELLFARDYPYFSSVSSTLLEHAAAHAEDLIDARGLGPDSLVIEIASNDGYLLRNFVARGIPCFGIDPAEAPGRAARAKGVATRTEFFTEEMALKMRACGETADVVIANNVLAHVADLNGFVAGIAAILRPTGVAVIEVPHVRELLEKCAFDTIYHQHLCYFSVSVLVTLFERHGLHLNDVRRIPAHGGSLRLSVEPRRALRDSVGELIELERAAGVDQSDRFIAFRHRVETIRGQLVGLLRQLKSRGARVAVYGAAGKSTTLLSHCGIDATLVDYVVDKNEYKHGRFLPGTRLEIFPTERLLAEVPEYCLLVVWNLADEILAQQAAYRDAGGRFILPIPEVRVV